MSNEIEQHKIEDAIANWGGYLARMLQTLNAYRTRYGTWPTKLYLPTDALKVLKDHHLTEFGFNLLRSKVHLLSGDDYRLSAQDETGRGFDYGCDAWSGNEPDIQATEWLGFGQF